MILYSGTQEFFLVGHSASLLEEIEIGKKRGSEMGTYSSLQTSAVDSTPTTENMEFWAGPHESPSNLSRSK